MIRAYVAGGALLALIALGGFLYLKGGASERAAEAARDANDYRATRERIDDANTDDRTPGAIRDRLRSLAQ